ncbi:MULTISPECIES: hypothetical protein [Nocardiaceae]|uniref:hypothetical protein n=1 Tax=Nocardiaceae TaxID=85025 RepID=UPI00068FD781|nr:MULTISPECIES: hypothetical protein [Rhodococcus]OZE36121.1 hypothetical protein CH259_13555 [Rhodococcus sp. 05-2254-4]OZE41240.1 hypothetical protein CH261_25060 [Rhodococcus sp. 05-2254-3]OZE44587.1 hypothetical protein CH283_27315 [Rhodococcus sp. 05-2254-2]OZE94311.1 hypothetical protein CH302_20210 [Rhodococcus sp. 15-2388-1-1a]
MAVSDVRPYLVPAVDTVQPSTWFRSVDGEWEPLGDAIENWDYRSELRLRCTIEVDPAVVRAQSMLDDGSPLAFHFGWRALDTYLVGPSVRVSLSENYFEVIIEIDPQFAGATISLTRRLVLERDRLSPLPGEARHAGSILWSDEQSLRLTGTEAMFPTEVVDFEAFGIDNGASWHLRMPPSPDEPAMGALLLLLNPLDTKLVKAVQKEKNHTDEQLALIQEMEEDLVQEIVRWSLAHWDELEDCDKESFGAAARSLALRVLDDPAAWTAESVLSSSMDLRSSLVAGARSIGFGRLLS